MRQIIRDPETQWSLKIAKGENTDASAQNKVNPPHRPCVWKMQPLGDVEHPQRDYKKANCP
jgi:hypothetical protein